MKAVVIVSHGSRSPQIKRELDLLRERLRCRDGIDILECAFLEMESPSIPEALEGCVRRGSDDVLVLLNFLNSGRHVDEDIPRIVGEVARRHPRVRFQIAPAIGQHPRIYELFLDLIDSHLPKCP